MEGPSYRNKMLNVQHVTPGQRKIFYLSQVKYDTADDSIPIQYEPYVADQFYDGHEVDNRSNLLFKLHQFGFLVETIPRGSILITLGAIGGIGEFALPLLSYCKSFFEFLWEKFYGHGHKNH